MLYAYTPAYFFSINFFDYVQYRTLKSLENDAEIQEQLQEMSANSLNSVFYKFGMILLVGGITWLVNERELVMFFREQD